MKHLKTLWLPIMFFLVSCGSAKQISSQEWNEIGLDGYMVTTFDKTINKVQLDSLCYAENISHNLKDWSGLMLYEEETNKQVHQYLFIKADDAETMYTVQDMNDSTYYVVIRKIKEDNIE